MVTFCLAVLGVGSTVCCGVFGLASMREGESRAARIGLGAALVTLAAFLLAAMMPLLVKVALLGLVALFVLAGATLFFLPVGGVQRGNDVPQKRFDERDIMFARARLIPGSADYSAYYDMRPENKASDDTTRSLSGLLSPGASEANPFIFAAADACFGLTATLRDVVDGPVAPTRSERAPVVMTAYIKDLARYFGAHTVGIAELQPYHVYSHVGRGQGGYGSPISLKHRYAIAFTVEMDLEMVGAGPAAPTVLESARQYVEAAKIAIELANLARSQGYPARAHVDGNYRVIAPLVARDAGLGEIGRMGLLMTATLGPRVRLGVVTTDLPLVPDDRSHDTSILDFCKECKKCADVCPVRAIPHGDREEIDGVLRWRINADLCYRYWCVVGTDCGRCMAVCPYSHPNNSMHNLARRAVLRSGFARRTMLWLDDLVYARKPPPKPAPPWVPHAPRAAAIDAPAVIETQIP